MSIIPQLKRNNTFYRVKQESLYDIPTIPPLAFSPSKTAINSINTACSSVLLYIPVLEVPPSGCRPNGIEHPETAKRGRGGRSRPGHQHLQQKWGFRKTISERGQGGDTHLYDVTKMTTHFHDLSSFERGFSNPQLYRLLYLSYIMHKLHPL